MPVIAWYILFILCSSVQLFYLFLVFGSLVRSKRKNTISSVMNPGQPAVTILLIVKNELENLQALIPLLIQQDYLGEFDIHIIDDHSTDDTISSINEWKNDKGIRLYIHALPKPGEGKKDALKYALSLDTFELLLTTDADCRPRTTKWLSSMVDHMGDDKAIVLGYSPYYHQSGGLNHLIQVETTNTALLYLSMAQLGMAYMGVGRNTLYRKSVLTQSLNLSKYSKVLSGDDDLTVNELSKTHRTDLQISPEAIVDSIPKTSWTSWIRQKSRHVSTARYYRPVHQFVLLIYYSSLVLSWVLPLGLMFFSPWILIIFLTYKGLYFFKFRTMIRQIFDERWRFSDWIIGEGAYVFALIWLTPSSLYKKNTEW
jgi:glycosyltransferase involved in cell wall biosynthesis